MKYDFDTNIDRTNRNSVKWSGNSNELPMWIADMDFKVCNHIVDSIRSVLDHGIFGYSTIPKEYYDTIITWWRDRYNYNIESDWILHSQGVVPSISIILDTLTNKGDKVLLQSPVYHVFYHCINDLDRVVISNELIYEDGKYYVDFDDLERKLQEVDVMILCNPHNPISRAFDRDTLRRIGELCIKHNVVVIADEIHCDLTKDNAYIPFASLSEDIANITISTFSPHKTFNIADLHVSCLVISNKVLRDRLERALRIRHIGTSNIFGITASIAAYSHGQEWLAQLLNYLWENERLCRDFVHKELSELHITESNATYLLWIDCKAFMNDRYKDSDSICAFLRKDSGLYVSSGVAFGRGGEHFLRLNIATSRARLQDGLDRLKRSLHNLRKG